MAIEFTKLPKMKNTPKGPVAQPAGTPEPKIDSSADADALQAAAQSFLKKNTAPAEEAAPAAAPKEEVPTGFKALDFLTEQSKTAKGPDKERIEGKIAKLTSESGQHFNDMHDAINKIRTAYDAVKNSLGGLVTKDSQERDVDQLGPEHMHIHNLINQAARHITAASEKDEPGTRVAGIRSAASILAGKTGTRVRPSDVATGGYDTLEKYSPIDPSERAPSEAESIEHLNSYVGNNFLKQAQDFESMGAADHVEHARNLLAGITLAAPKLVSKIKRMGTVTVLAANSGKPLPNPDDVKSMLEPSLLSFAKPAQKYIDFAKSNPGGSASQAFAPNTNRPIDRFGLNHHLTRLKNLAESEETQRSHEQRINIITNAYKSHLQRLAAAKKGAGSTISFDDYKELAKIGSPVRQSESYLQTGEHEEDVDPTMGGLKGADEPMRLRNTFGYTGRPAGSRVTTEVVTSASSSGFNVPSDRAVEKLIERRSRRATLQASIDEASRAGSRNTYRYDPFFTGSVAPLGGTEGGIANEVSNSFIRPEKNKYVGDDGLLRPAVDINPSDPEPTREDAQAQKDYTASLRSEAKRKSNTKRRKISHDTMDSLIQSEGLSTTDDLNKLIQDHDVTVGGFKMLSANPVDENGNDITRNMAITPVSEDDKATQRAREADRAAALFDARGGRRGKR